MSDEKVIQSVLKAEDVEAAVKEEQRAPGGLKMDIVLSPALTKSSPKPNPYPSSPHTQAELETKQQAVISRKEMLTQLRAKSISSQLAKVEEAKQKREEINTVKSTKSKEVLETKLEVQERNRATLLQQQKEKMAEEVAKVERATRELEIQMEASRVAAECTIKAKLTKAQENRDEQLEETKKKMKEHDQYIAEVRQSQNKMLTEDKNKMEVELNNKIEKAAKERQRQEQDLRNKLEERNKHAELVRKNKEKMVNQGDIVPESA